MIKTLLVTTGAVLLAATGLQAAPGSRSFAGGRGYQGGYNRPASRVSPQYSAGYRGRGAYGYRGYGGYRGGHYGHRYYLGGVPFFYDPFFFGFGYYGGYGYPYGYGYGYDNPYTAGYYNGRIADSRNRDQDDDDDNKGDPRQEGAAALPKAVQKQLAQRGYYHGTVDGEFGPASKSALTRFQKDHDLHATGRIDPATMKALGFEDRG